MVRHGEGRKQAQSVANLLELFIGPLEEWLDDQLDRRLVRTFFLALADLQEAGETPLALWDESVLEKSESIALEGLGPVRSSKAARLKHIKPGCYNPPGGRPVFVPGLQRITVMVAGYSGPPALAAMRWWTRGALWLPTGSPTWSPC